MENLLSLNELRRLVIDKGLCAACGGCVGGCPYLVAFRGNTVVLDACVVENGSCYAACPVIPPDYTQLLGLVFKEPFQLTGIGMYHSIMASKAADENVAVAGQGGGTVTAIIMYALENGFIDSAVLTSVSEYGSFPAGVVAETISDVRSCAGSKYVGAHSLSALRRALDMGKKAIGVVGLPCQVLSVRKTMLADIKQEGLRHRIKFLVGLFCNWAFSARQFTAFMADRFPGTLIKRVHIPPPPANCLEVETDGGITAVSLEDVRGFIQAACRRCPDMTSELADVSVGMFEGRPGWNTLVVRSDFGREVVGKAIKSGVLETDVFPEANLAHLESASRQKKQRSGQPQS